jgi:hypothetical protein
VCKDGRLEIAGTDHSRMRYRQSLKRFEDIFVGQSWQSLRLGIGRHSLPAFAIGLLVGRDTRRFPARQPSWGERLVRLFPRCLPPCTPKPDLQRGLSTALPCRLRYGADFKYGGNYSPGGLRITAITSKCRVCLDKSIEVLLGRSGLGTVQDWESVDDPVFTAGRGFQTSDAVD